MKILRLLFLAITFALAVCAGAQMIPQTTIDSIDVTTMQATDIVVGTIKDVDEPRPEGAVGVRIKVSECLKGIHEDSMAISIESDQSLTRWKERASRLLVIGNGSNKTTIVDLDSGNFLFSNKEFNLYRKPDELLAYIRKLLHNNLRGQVAQTYTLVPPDNDIGKAWKEAYKSKSYPRLLVPLDPWLEKRGQKMALSRSVTDRFVAVDILRHFQSDENVAFLKRLFRDQATSVQKEPDFNRGFEERTFPVRQRAINVLQEWGITFVPPPLTYEVNKLDSARSLYWTGPISKNELDQIERGKKLQHLFFFGGEHPADFFEHIGRTSSIVDIQFNKIVMSDQEATQLAKLKNLGKLVFVECRVPDKGLITLANLPSLKHLGLIQTSVSAESLNEILRLRPDLKIDPEDLVRNRPHFIDQTNAKCEIERYRLYPGSTNNWTSSPVGRFVGPIQWSKSPSGRPYFGPYGQQSLTLNLRDIPPHRNIELDIDLFVIGSWDGDGSLGAGPDIMDIQVPNLGTLLHSTFFNNNEGNAKDLTLQSYPDPYPFGKHKGYTGAAEVRSLGFTEPWDGQLHFRDAVYTLHYTFAHRSPTLELVLSGLTVPQDVIQNLLDDEHWGIANLVVRTD